jgi:hypothetical protein
MELDGAALEGLEVLENALGGTAGSLLALLDHCATPFGRRRLRRWLTRPLLRAADITRRQDAVEVRAHARAWFWQRMWRGRLPRAAVGVARPRGVHAARTHARASQHPHTPGADGRRL